MPESAYDMLMRVVSEDEDTRDAAVDTLVRNLKVTLEEVITALDVLHSMSTDPSPKVRKSVCYGLLRCVAACRNFEIDVRQNTKDLVLMTMESMENDTDPEVHEYVLETEKTVRTLARWEGLR